MEEMKLNANQKVIVEQMRKNPGVTRYQLSVLLEINDTSVGRNIRKLRERGIIRRVGPNQRGKMNGHWEVLI